MKKFIICALTLLLSFNLFAKNGSMIGAHNIQSAKTKWFDIIYPEECEISAKILFTRVDDIYEEVAASYGMKPRIRMPLVLTPEVEQFNAYWSSGYYNHIVLYDTGSIDDLDVFSERLVSTFRHEVTHAFTFNIRPDFYKYFPEFIATFLDTHALTLTSGWAEGATLTSESSFGEGRLNDEYAKHMVKQAKIENIFPDYHDVQGSSDIYPFGSFYYFNGAFDEYLQKTYGMEKYAQMWFNMVNNYQDFTVQRTFLRIYGIKLRTAWKDFSEQYQVPEVEANPVAAGTVQDFFNPSAKDYSMLNNGRSRYNNLSKNSKGLIFTNDADGSNIFFVSNQKLTETTVKPEKIFSKENLQEASSSADGKIIAINYLDALEPNYKYKTSVITTEKHSQLNIPGTGYKQSSIVKNGDDYYLVSLRFFSINNYINVKKLVLDNGKLKASEDFAEIECDTNVQVSDFVDLQNGTFAFVKKDRLTYSICISTLEGKILKEIKAPYEKMVIKGLSYDNSRLWFSYTVPGSMPRVGNINPQEMKFQLCQNDFSGGMFSPVILEEDILYKAKFFRLNRLFRVSKTSLTFTEVKAEEVTTKPITEDEQTYRIRTAYPETLYNLNFELPSTPYNFGKYLFKGAWIPVSEIYSTSYDPDHASSYSLPIGLTLITNNPWDGNLLTLSLGYGTKTNSAGLRIKYDSGSSTNMFYYSLDSTTEFDKLGWKMADFNGLVNFRFNMGNRSKAGFNITSQLHYGRSNLLSSKNNYDSWFLRLIDFNGAFNEDKTNYFYGYGSSNLSYSNVYSSGPGLYEYSGFSLVGGVYYNYNGSKEKVYKNGGEVACAATVYIPRILPHESKIGYTTNLPSKLYLNLFTTRELTNSSLIEYCNVPVFSGARLPYFSLASASFETVLFEKSIQKAGKLIPEIFYNDFSIILDLVGGIENTAVTYSQNWKITRLPDYFGMVKNGVLKVYGYPAVKFVAGITPNFGTFANSQFRQDFCVRVGLNFFDKQPCPVIDFCMNVGF